MPLPLAVSLLGSNEGLVRLATYGGGAALLFAVRKWAAGYRAPDMMELGELSGKTYILTGAFSGPGLEVFSALALRGAQVIALHPSPLSPPVVQLLTLLRSATSNDRLYADACDLSSLVSVRTFVQQWSKDARGGMVGDLEARIDGVVFCDDLDSEAVPYGVPAVEVEQAGGESIERYKAEHLTGRHALVQLLMPLFLRQASTSSTPVRVVNCVNPFYSAVVPGQEALDPGRLGVSGRKASWRAMGEVGAASVLLWEEFSRRLAASTASSSTTSSPPADEGAEKSAPTPSLPVLAFSLCPGLTRSTVRTLLRASPSHPSFSLLGFAFYLLLSSLLYLLLKSSGSAAESVLGAVLADEKGRKREKRVLEVEGEGVGEEERVRMGRRDEGGEWERGRFEVRGGGLYREGREVRVPLFAKLPASTPVKVWEYESKLVERVRTGPLQLLLYNTLNTNRDEQRRRAGRAGNGDASVGREGWETSTSTVYVTNTDEVPTAVTVYTTYGESPVVDGGTVVETVYKGADTVTILGPSYLTLTFYPTTTTYSTSRVTVPTTTKTKTKTPAAQSTATVCAKGDADKKEFTGLKPTHDQSVTLYVIAIYIVGIAIGWNLFILRDLLYPFKYFTVAVHEMGHVLLTICLGFRIGYLEIDPKLGGLTRMAIGDEREHPIPFAALPIGYVFNIVWGGLLVFCGFDTLASKIASFIVGLCWIGVFLRVEIPAKIMTLGAVGLMIGLWFVDHAWGLRFYILFMGVMSSFYVLWDVADDAFFAKQNPCCPSLHFQAMPALGPGAWTAIYFVLSFVFFVGFILAGLATWKQDPHAMYCQAQTFLPTR
ncbi:hypothetical protein JCM8547_000592 [Rhodosporidiobolus lusitaniae]